MADREVEARLRDLKRRVASEPGSRFFVQLAEEYRKAGRLPEAIKVLEDGIVVHPGYVAARVALGRVFLEAGRIEESLAAFSRVLADDPSNLVAAKALGDIHLSRGEKTEALKRYLRFRAVSGDRRLDDVIARLSEEAGPAPGAAREVAASAPAPPAIHRPESVAPVAAPAHPPLMVSTFPAIDLTPPSPARRETDPFDITSVPYAPLPEAGPIVPEPAEEMLSRDVRLGEAPSGAEGVTRKLRLPESTWPFEPTPEAPPSPAAAVGPAETAAAALAVSVGEPVAAQASGGALVELEFDEGQPGEGLHLAEELFVVESKHEGALRLSNEDSDFLAAPDAGRDRRLAKIRLLNQWLASVQHRSRQ